MRRQVVVRDARGHYALPTADEARRAAGRLNGVVSGLSAAAALGWELKSPPTRPRVTVPAKRRVSPERRVGVEVRWRDLDPDDVSDGVLRLVVEADSFEFHGRRKALKRDCERYNALVVRGWVVLRFSWEHVMFDPTYVRDSLARWTQRQETSRSGRRAPR